MEAIMPAACLEPLSYERMETLGDAFLKYSACLHLFLQFPMVRQITSRWLTVLLAQDLTAMRNLDMDGLLQLVCW
jgi:dsRNA-specific ribonuclease